MSEGPGPAHIGAPPGPKGAGADRPLPAHARGLVNPNRRGPVAGALALVVMLFAALTPWPLDAKMRLVGFACCTQAPTRTLHIGAVLMPLDARDAGLYLGLLLGLTMAVAVGRGRCGRWPPVNVAALVGGLFVVMVLDGINSSLQTHGLHSLYHTTNPLRVITGVAAGLALAILALPLVNRIVWREPENNAVTSDYAEVTGFAVAGVVVAALLLGPRPWLYYPLSLLSIVGVLVGWGLVNGVIAVVALRRENRAVTWSDGGIVLLAGIALTLCEMWVIDSLRAGHL